MSEVDDEMRRRAKTINFGLLYGMSAFGLANQLAVSRTEAEIFLNNYFERYSAVKKFMSDIVESSKELKYVETLYGRKIHVPNITANKYMVRQAAERAAINGPLQGSAADIIKIAMIKIDDWINHTAPEINMILQVNDELVYEVPDTFSDDDLRPILDLMENTTEIDVPLKVEYGFGTNWREAH